MSGLPQTTSSTLFTAFVKLSSQLESASTVAATALSGAALTSAATVARAVAPGAAGAAGSWAKQTDDSANAAVAIEKATNGAIQRSQLRPDLFD